MGTDGQEWMVAGQMAQQKGRATGAAERGPDERQVGAERRRARLRAIYVAAPMKL
ncbi:UNVERIFIED_CONTAM: hypothetical protein Sradi_3350400 [Sesamum radiatum]|uniref:Uncharacterized protein n=1 Tax=Sesamum radiatum TaxID=300843 RepID=A0AAW2R2M1_SESRA